MPHLAFLAVLGAGAYVAWRTIGKLIEGDAPRTADIPVRDRRDGGAARDQGALEYDPVAGVYRPRR
jgi:hypothetical protein